MVNFSNGFVLLPFYSWPTGGTGNKSNYAPLFKAAAAYPNTPFLLTINPDNGPGTTCPPQEYAQILDKANSFPNIATIGYLHTGYGTESPGERPADEIIAEIDMYNNWNTPSNCGNTLDTHLSGIWFDEAPPNKDKYDYMSQLSSHAKNTFPGGAYTLFNVGALADPVMWDITDFICTFEKSQRHLNQKDIDLNNNQKAWYKQSTVIVNDYNIATGNLSRDVMSIIGKPYDRAGGLLIVDGDDYQHFPTWWMKFVKAVDDTIAHNKASSKLRAMIRGRDRFQTLVSEA